MSSKFLYLDFPSSLHLQLLPNSSQWLRKYSLVSSNDLMIVNSISSSATLLYLIKGSYNLKLFYQWLILRYCGKSWRMMLLIADNYMAYKWTFTWKEGPGSF